MNFKNLFRKKAICLNEQTAGGLRRYLKTFPDNAKVVLAYDSAEKDVVICCNFEHQRKTNKVMLMPGRSLRID